MYLNILGKLHAGDLRELKLGRILHRDPAGKEMGEDYPDSDNL